MLLCKQKSKEAFGVSLFPYLCSNLAKLDELGRKVSGADPGFGQKGTPGSKAEIEVSYLQLGSRAHLMALEALGVLMLKYAFSHILETLFLVFNIVLIEK